MVRIHHNYQTNAARAKPVPAARCALHSGITDGTNITKNTVYEVMEAVQNTVRYEPGNYLVCNGEIPQTALTWSVLQIFRKNVEW